MLRNSAAESGPSFASVFLEPALDYQVLGVIEVRRIPSLEVFTYKTLEPFIPELRDSGTALTVTLVWPARLFVTQRFAAFRRARR